MRQKLEQILTEYWCCGDQGCHDRDRTLKSILDEIAIFINKIEPLEASGNWEDSEDIAYGVKCLIVQKIQNEKDEKNKAKR